MLHLSMLLFKTALTRASQSHMFSVHIIPRKPNDLDHQGGPDSIYDSMDGEPGNIGKAFVEMQRAREQRVNKRDFSGGPDADRKPRSDKEMQKEAEWFREEMAKDDTDETQ